MAQITIPFIIILMPKMTTRERTSFGDQSRKALTNADNEVAQPSPTHQSAHHSPSTTQMASPLRFIQQGNVDKGGSSRG
ncbi:hypothetical protein Tco_0403109, partial [Tanacetum coccineum]